MRRKTSLFCCLAVLTGCNTPLKVNQPIPSAQQTTVPVAQPVASTAPLKQDTPARPSTVPAPTGPVPVAVSSGQPGIDLTVLASLELQGATPYLNNVGQTTQLIPLLKSKTGETLDPVKYPLQWSSLRPADFSVDATGKVTALVENGYTIVYVQVPGTSLTAQYQLSITTVESGGSGASSAKPSSEKISGSVKFEF